MKRSKSRNHCLRTSRNGENPGLGPGPGRVPGSPGRAPGGPREGPAGARAPKSARDFKTDFPFTQGPEYFREKNRRKIHLLKAPQIPPAGTSCGRGPKSGFFRFFRVFAKSGISPKSGFLAIPPYGLPIEKDLSLFVH